MATCTTVITRTRWSGCGAVCTRRGVGTWCSRRHQGIRSARSPAGITRRAITARCTPATLTCSCLRAVCRRRTGSRTWPRRSSPTSAPVGLLGTVSSRGKGSSGSEERTGLQPRYRRAFGCVTWVYMGMLVFLAANFLLVLPSRYLGSGDLYGYLPPRLAFLGTVLILPGMALAAVLGYSGFFGLEWLAIAFGLDQRDQVFRTVLFHELGGTFAFYAFVPLTLVATGLVVFAIYGKTADFGRRRNFFLAGAVLAVLAGIGVVVTDFDPLGVLGALVSTVSGAVGGYVSGSGYTRAGGDDMVTSGAVHRSPPNSGIHKY